MSWLFGTEGRRAFINVHTFPSINSVEENPPPKANGKRPDYRVEDRYFDCYAPSSSNLDNIRDMISDSSADGSLPVIAATCW